MRATRGGEGEALCLGVYERSIERQLTRVNRIQGSAANYNSSFYRLLPLVSFRLCLCQTDYVYYTRMRIRNFGIRKEETRGVILIILEYIYFFFKNHRFKKEKMRSLERVVLESISNNTWKNNFHSRLNATLQRNNSLSTTILKSSIFKWIRSWTKMGRSMNNIQKDSFYRSILREHRFRDSS